MRWNEHGAVTTVKSLDWYDCPLSVVRRRVESMAGITGAGSAITGPVGEVSRRGFIGRAAALTAGLTAIAGMTAGTAAWARTRQGWSARGNRVRLTLPTPTGGYGIGTVALHLADHSRQDPFLADPRARE